MQIPVCQTGVRPSFILCIHDNRDKSILCYYQLLIVCRRSTTFSSEISISQINFRFPWIVLLCNFTPDSSNLPISRSNFLFNLITLFLCELLCTVTYLLAFSCSSCRLTCPVQLFGEHMGNAKGSRSPRVPFSRLSRFPKCAPKKYTAPVTQDMYLLRVLIGSLYYVLCDWPE